MLGLHRSPPTSRWVPPLLCIALAAHAPAALGDAKIWTFDSPPARWTATNASLQFGGTWIYIVASNTDPYISSDVIDPGPDGPSGGTQFNAHNDSDERNYIRIGYRNHTSDDGGRIYVDYGSGFTQGNSMGVTFQAPLENP